MSQEYDKLQKNKKERGELGFLFSGWPFCYFLYGSSAATGAPVLYFAANENIPTDVSAKPSAG